MSKKNPFAGLTAEQINDVLKQAEAAKAQLVTKPATPAGKPFKISLMDHERFGKVVRIENHGVAVPLTLQPRQWAQLAGHMPEVLKFIKDNNLG